MQVSPHVHALRLPFVIHLAPGKTVERFVYAYLIIGSTICLIDSGVAGSEQVIFDYLATIDRRPEDISQLILTHAHPDHIGAARAVQQASDCLVAAHRQEKDWIEDVELQQQQRPVPGFNTLVDGAVHVDRVLRDNETVQVDDDLALQVFRTPGHSSGSISLLLYPDRVLFTGDALPVPGDIPIYEDVEASVDSIRRLQTLHDVNVLLGSWDTPRVGADDVAAAMVNALGVLQRNHAAVTTLGDQAWQLEPMALCEQALAQLNMPTVLANPLVARSFAAHLQVAFPEKSV